MTNYKQLCVELADIEDALMSGAALASNQGQALDGYSALASFRALANRARAALAEPDPTSLKEQALTALERWAEDEHGPGAVLHKGLLEVGLIRLALEALDD